MDIKEKDTSRIRYFIQLFDLTDSVVSLIGTISCIGALIWAVLVLIFKMAGLIDVSGWTTLFMFNLFSFGVIMLTLGILGGYLWRCFDASRNRPPYIVEYDSVEEALRKAEQKHEEEII